MQHIAADAGKYCEAFHVREYGGYCSFWLSNFIDLLSQHDVDFRNWEFACSWITELWVRLYKLCASSKYLNMVFCCQNVSLVVVLVNWTCKSVSRNNLRFALNLSVNQISFSKICTNCSLSSSSMMMCSIVYSLWLAIDLYCIYGMIQTKFAFMGEVLFIAICCSLKFLQWTVFANRVIKYRSLGGIF